MKDNKETKLDKVINQLKKISDEKVWGEIIIKLKDGVPVLLEVKKATKF